MFFYLIMRMKHNYINFKNMSLHKVVVNIINRKEFSDCMADS